MLAGWVTFEELEFITNFDSKTLRDLINYGVKRRCLKYQGMYKGAGNHKTPITSHKHFIYNLADFEKCLSLFS